MISEYFLYALAIVMTICLIAQYMTAKVIELNLKGLIFLKEAQEIILLNEDEQELNILMNNDIPSILFLHSEINKIYRNIQRAMYANITLLLFTLLPSLYNTFIWDVTIGLVAGLTANVILSFKITSLIKHKINAICETYYMILQAYEFIKADEEGENDDSVK